jgi:uncharacterized protein YbbC (DUF1343 family)
MTTVQPGIEVLLKNSPLWLRDKRIGLLVNQASVDSRLRHTADLLVQAFPRSIRALFGPQHGIRGEKQDNMVESSDLIHPRFRIPAFSLYGTSRSPTAEMLELIDILIIDLQDVGTRVYTFISTMAHCLQAAAQWGKKVVVLDRPNPIDGERVEGNLVREDCRSFVGMYPLPMRHGLTIGELALLFNNGHGICCELEVIAMQGWRRSMLFRETGLAWVSPSPNMPSPETALVYPGQVLLEGTNLSEGRGTTRPFELFGAPFIDPACINEKMDQRQLPGVTLREAYFEPTFNKWQGLLCGGLQLHVTEPRLFKPYITTLSLLQDVLALYPRHFSWSDPPYEYEHEKLPIDLVAGDRRVREALEREKPISEVESSWQEDLQIFEQQARNHHLYH